MSGFSCPYCDRPKNSPTWVKANLGDKLIERVMCPGCGVEMAVCPVNDLVDRGKIRDQYLTTGEVDGVGIVRAFTPWTIKPSMKLFAVFPARGFAQRWPVHFVIPGEQHNLGLFSPSHPQTDSPWAKFVTKGLLYSGLMNAAILAFFPNAAIWLFLLLLLMGSGVYVYLVRPVPVPPKERRRFVNEQ